MFGDMTELVVLFVLFVVVSLPVTYDMVNQLLSAVGLSEFIKDITGSITNGGVLFHGLVFVLLYCVYKRYVAPMMDMEAPGPAPSPAEGEVEEFMEHQEEEEEKGQKIPTIYHEEENVVDHTHDISEDSDDVTGGVSQDVDADADADADAEEFTGFEGFSSGNMGAAY